MSAICRRELETVPKVCRVCLGEITGPLYRQFDDEEGTTYAHLRCEPVVRVSEAVPYRGANSDYDELFAPVEEMEL